MVRVNTIAAAAVMAGSALAAPAPQTPAVAAGRNPNYEVLQFALTLEHLENEFYKGALNNFTVQDFEAAGYSADYYNNLQYITYDEQTHVQALTAALKAAGQQPVPACQQYSFPYTNVKSFIALSALIENVGTSAYLGAAGLITDPAYLTVAGAILAVEALHTSYQRAAIGEVPMENPFQTPLAPQPVYTLASMFIKRCTNQPYNLGITPYPYLATDGTTCSCEEPTCSSPSQYIKRQQYGGWGWGGPGGWHPSPQPACKPPAAGASVTYTSAAAVQGRAYLTYVNGLTVTSTLAQVSGGGKTITGRIPTGLAGQTYVFVTSNSVTSFATAKVISGPAVIEVLPPAAGPLINDSITK